MERKKQKGRILKTHMEKKKKEKKENELIKNIGKNRSKKQIKTKCKYRPFCKSNIAITPCVQFQEQVLKEFVRKIMNSLVFIRDYIFLLTLGIIVF